MGDFVIGVCCLSKIVHPSGVRRVLQKVLQNGRYSSEDGPVMHGWCTVDEAHHQVRRLRLVAGDNSYQRSELYPK